MYLELPAIAKSATMPGLDGSWVSNGVEAQFLTISRSQHTAAETLSLVSSEAMFTASLQIGALNFRGASLPSSECIVLVHYLTADFSSFEILTMGPAVEQRR